MPPESSLEETSGFSPPQPSLERLNTLRAWKNFHESILNKGDALNYVTDFVDSVIKDEYEITVFESYKNEGEISKIDIHSYYLNLLSNQKDKSDKNIWNIENNLLRVLKRFKSNEPLEFLPYQDIKLADEFVKMLKTPPRD